VCDIVNVVYVLLSVVNVFADIALTVDDVPGILCCSSE